VLLVQFHTPGRWQGRVQFHMPGYSDKEACEPGAGCLTSACLLAVCSQLLGVLRPLLADMPGGVHEIVHPSGPGLRTLVCFVSQPLRETLFTDPLPSLTLLISGPRGSLGRFPKVAGGSQSPPRGARHLIIHSQLDLRRPTS
jgi:hypothetical protein